LKKAHCYLQGGSSLFNKTIQHPTNRHQRKFSASKVIISRKCFITKTSNEEVMKYLDIFVVNM
jgi:hypothetical protein